MQRYLVTIHYREPTYEQHTGRGPRPYRGTFAVDAPHEDAAVARAREAFRRWSEASGVSWVREEVGVECALDEGDATPSVSTPS